MKIAIVTSRFNELITEKLHQGAVATLKRYGQLSDEAITSMWVPGAFELPLAAKRLAKSHDAVIALGCVIKGATDHYDYVCSATASGLQTVALEAEKPVLFGVLTTDTIEQAIERAGTKAGNKGADSAMAAIDLIETLNSI